MKTTTPSSFSTRTEDDGLPRILTYADVPMLAQDLDASDTLELYLLTRPAILHGLANNTVTVTKRAIGLRYLPQTRSSSSGGGAMSSSSAPLELTLEYGPARRGVALQHEALPRLVVAANAGDTDDATDDEAFISWDNDAKIYFTNDIAHATYTTANYVASLTGAVLQDLLYACCDYYAGVRGRRRRYQPFTVMVPPSSVDGNSGNSGNSNPELLLKSSSDLDFVTFVWQHLADVGVDLAPLLPPLQHRLVLHSTSMERVRVGTTVSQQQVARFYRHLYACWEALATANVSTTMTPPPVVVAGATPSAAPSTTTVQRRRIQDDGANNDDEDPTASPTSSNAVVSSSAAAPSVAASAHIGSVELPSTAPTTISATTTATPLAPTTSRPSAWPVSHSDQAAQAAQQAQQAAQDAANAGDNPAAAAQAAQQAAQAAQQAADTTVRQKAAQVREQMLHGDGSTMVNAMVTCFANPTYRLATIDGGDSNNDTMVTAYLYWDGVTYYRANLTPPYASIVTLDYHMPPPLQTRSHARIGGNGNNDGGGGGDLVDWTVFFLIAAFFLVGTLMLAQQVFGRNFRVIPPLYRLQRYFFDPLSYNYAELDDESERDKKSRGLGQEYAFAQDVIPLSMGGRRADHVPAEFASNGWPGDWSGGNDGLMMRRPRSPAMVRTTQTPRSSPTSSSARSAPPPVLHHWGPASDHGDVELMPVPSSSSLSRPSSRPHDMLRSPYASDNDDDEVEFFENAPGNGILEDSSRLFRDPDLVDLPNLTSRSKVAVPVSMTLSSSQHHRRPSEASSTNSSQHHETTSMMGFDEL